MEAMNNQVKMKKKENNYSQIRTLGQLGCNWKGPNYS